MIIKCKIINGEIQSIYDSIFYEETIVEDGESSSKDS